MANPEQDFEGYMEDVATQQARQQADEAMQASHQLWRETTWQGRAVGLIHGIGQHFKPFFDAVAEALREEKSTGSRLMEHLVRILIVCVGIVALYIVANIIQMVIGKEIVVEQDIVIIEEVRQSDLDNEQAKRDETVTVESSEPTLRQRGSRDKKTQ